MRRMVLALSATAAILAAGGSAYAAGNSNSGSGLSPYAAESGNDRSAGVNNGNYTPRRYRTYPGYERPVRGYDYDPAPRPYYGYPY